MKGKWHPLWEPTTYHKIFIFCIWNVLQRCSKFRRVMKNKWIKLPGAHRKGPNLWCSGQKCPWVRHRHPHTSLPSGSAACSKLLQRMAGTIPLGFLVQTQHHVKSKAFSLITFIQSSTWDTIFKSSGWLRVKDDTIFSCFIVWRRCANEGYKNS